MTGIVPKVGTLVRLKTNVTTTTKSKVRHSPPLPSYLAKNLVIPKGTVVMYMGCRSERDVGWEETDFQYDFLHDEKIYKSKWTIVPPHHFFDLNAEVCDNE